MNDDIRNGYTPIEDYAAVGNLRTAALVSRYGAVDWCCMPQLDSPSVFAAILDHRRGGRFRVGPAGNWRRGEQRYQPETNVLETWWDTDGGRLTVIDFMPLRGAIVPGEDPAAAPALYRVIRCAGAACDVEIEWAPRFDYARATPELALTADGAVAHAGDESLRLLGLADGAEIVAAADGQPSLKLRLTMRDGDTLPLLMHYGADDGGCAPADWQRACETTADAWRGWLSARDQGERCSFAGPWQPLVDRSGLALKLLTYPRTGAIAAAATTSLPEDIGGVRNWDYRYTWIRDASFTAQALVALGHSDEAIGFLQWAEDVTRRDEAAGGKLHLMYTLDGVSDIPERELDHLEGYCGSRPVRIGNKAAGQFQLDIYGELLDAAWEMARLGVSIDGDLWKFLSHVADQACARWTKPDYGIWEVRSEPRHFVYSKLMVHVALDRALRLADRFGLPADRERWKKTRDAVRSTILERGYDEERGAFVQSFGDTALDAANLHIPLVGFLPVDDPRVQSTIDLYLEELTENGVVYRYRTGEGGVDDGLPGEEGAFGLTTFWMVDALALSGRLDEANEMFEGAARRANHVGLYSEEFDPRSGAFLGNFPQAFTHIGFINSTVYLAHAEGRPVPAPAPIGSPEERQEREDSEGSG
jgi:GH15 family glucan-1,4-alpha-glucosidase